MNIQGKISKNFLFTHLPKVLVLIGCIAYEIYLFFTYSSYYLKYAFIPVDLLIGGHLALVLSLLLLRIVKKIRLSKRLGDINQTKRFSFLLIYFTVMGYLIFLPTVVFSLSIAGYVGIIFSFPAISLLLIEIVFLLIMRSQQSIDKWEKRFNKKKIMVGGIIIIILILPLSIDLLYSKFPIFSSTPEISISTSYDAEAYPDFTPQFQQQVLDNASAFSLDSESINGSIQEYVSMKIEKNQLTEEKPPNFIYAALAHLSYDSIITVYQSNFTLNSTILEYSEVRISSTEEPSLTWDIYPDWSIFWIYPALNISVEEKSSVNLTAPIFFCEFDVTFSSRFGGWDIVCDIRQRVLLDSNGQILIISREDSCWAFA